MNKDKHIFIFKNFHLGFSMKENLFELFPDNGTLNQSWILNDLIHFRCANAMIHFLLNPNVVNRPIFLNVGFLVSSLKRPTRQSDYGFCRLRNGRLILSSNSKFRQLKLYLELE